MRLRALIRRTVCKFDDDHCLGIAAQLAFYFVLALFPALLFLVALLSYLPTGAVFADILTALEAIAPGEVVTLLRGQLDQIAGGDQNGLLTIGVLGALWSSSAAMVALIDALNRAYDVAERRPWWKRRIVAVMLTVALALCTIAALGLIGAGPAVIAHVTNRWGLAPALSWTWQLLRWPLLLACVMLGVDLVYHFAPNRRRRWVWMTPGGAVGTLLWLGVSFGFKLYVINAADYTATYGVIGGAIVTMLWFYLSGLALLIGAELNAVVEHESARPA
jgi:membrane protein